MLVWTRIVTFRLPPIVAWPMHGVCNTFRTPTAVRRYSSLECCIFCDFIISDVSPLLIAHYEKTILLSLSFVCLFFPFFFFGDKLLNK